MPFLIARAPEDVRLSVEQNSGTQSRLTLDELEQRYRHAHARLLAAQEEKTAATAEFIAARAALRCTLEAIWPDPSER